MAAEFYRDTLPRYVVRRPLDPLRHQELLTDTRERLAAMKAMLGRNDYGPVLGIARTLSKQAGLSLPDESLALGYLHRMLMLAFVELHEAAVANLSGDTSYTPKGGPIQDALDAPQDTGRTVEAAIEAYEAEKSPRWSGSTKKAVVPVFRLLRDVFPDRDIASVTRDEARSVVKLLEGLPANMGKRKELQGLTVPQAVERGKALGLPTIKPKTINDGYLLHIASLFNWTRKEQWTAANPFEGLTIHDPVDDADRRDPFTVDQLNTLFSAAPWGSRWTPGSAKAGAYWVPLLCLFQGLRLAEAAALRVEDVGEEDGHTVLYIRPYDGKRLKTRESRGWP